MNKKKNFNEKHDLEYEDPDDYEEISHREMFLNNKKTIMIAISAFVVIIIAFIAIAFSLTRKQADTKTSTGGINNSGQVQTEQASTAGSNAMENSTNETTVDTSTATMADVQTAAVDDAQDPQNQVSSDSGAVANATSLSGTISTNSNGIDVSKYQGQIDWNKVKAAGIDFAIIRVGYRTDKTGVIYEDPYAAYNLQHAQSAGVKIGVYFFSTAVSAAEAVEEANWVNNYIAKYSITYPVVYNCEGFTSSDSRMYNVTNADRTSYAMEFLSKVESAGYTGVLYAAKSELSGSKYWDTNKISASYKIWVAQYPDTPYPATSAPEYSGSYIMWQYTCKGVVDGISGYVDMNVASFSYESNAEAKDSSGTVAAAENNPELGITFVAANEYVTAKDETNLRSTPSTDGTLVGTLKYGEALIRTGVGDNGWSRLTYNGQTVYAKSSLLTTGAVESKATGSDSVTFTDVNEQVTAKSETNLRSVMSSSDTSSVVVTLKNGEYVTRVGIGDNGWSKLIYNGQTVYAITSYLIN